MCLSQILAKLNNVAPSGELKRLGDLPPKLGVTLTEMVAVVERTLHEEPYGKEEICKILGLTVSQLDETWLSERSRSGSADN